MDQVQRRHIEAGAGVLLVCVLAAASLRVGAAALTSDQLWDALTRPDMSNPTHLVVWALRLPRIVAALLVGGALGVAGALLQGLTRNPLADTGILGLEAGAAFVVVLGTMLLGTQRGTGTALLAAAGAGLTCLGIVVFGATQGTIRPLVVIVAGAAFSAGVSALTTMLLLLDQQTIQAVRFWLAGGLAGRTWPVISAVVPVLAVGLTGAALLARHVTALALSSASAQSLGVSTNRLQWGIIACVVVLVSGSVAVAGPIGFVGLIVPHGVRALVGSDYRWVIPFSCIGGGLLVVLADTAARTIAAPHEIPLGVVMACIGGPVFLALMRSRQTQ